MALDLIIRNARLSSAGPDNPAVDIGVRGGTIVAVEPNLAGDGPEHDARGKLVSPGLIESHFHLDKAMIIDRVPMQPDRMVRDHMKRTASIKHTDRKSTRLNSSHANIWYAVFCVKKKKKTQKKRTNRTPHQKHTYYDSRYDWR